MRAAHLATALFMLLVASACSSLPGGQHVADTVAGGGLGWGRITQEQLRDALVQYASRFEGWLARRAADTLRSPQPRDRG